MAFQFTDTFCTVTSLAQAPYETTSGSITYSSAYQRFTPPSGCAGGGIQIPANAFIRKNLFSNQATFIAFFSAGVITVPATNQSCLIAFLDNGTCQSFLAVNPNGSLQFFRGNSSGTVISGSSPSSPGLITAFTAPNAGIEIQLTFSASVGVAKCWLNGTLVTSATGLNTIQTGNAFANQVQLGATSGTIGGTDTGLYTDYLRVWDGTGSTQNAPVTLDRQPVTKLPSGVGTNSNMTPNGLTPAWRCVSVIPPNASDYASANGTNVIDDYTVPNAGLTQAPTQVVASSYFEKDDASTRTYTNGVLSSSSVGVGSTFTASSSYAWVQNCIPLDPATGVPWTAAGADAAHFLHEELT